MLNLSQVGALVLRYTYLYRRSVPRLIETLFWPLMDLFVWGFLTTYLTGLNPHIPSAVSFLVGAMLFWDILFRAQQGVTMSFLEDVWSRNLLNLFIAPIRLREFLAATYCVGILKILLILVVLGPLAYGLYAFNIMSIGFALIPLFLCLIMMGWALGMFATGLILRFGQAAEALAWAVPFLIQPISAVFYPVSALPPWLQPVARCLPSTHAFEGMRAVLRGEPFPTTDLLLAFGLNILYLAAAGLFFTTMYHSARDKGLLSKLGTQ